MTRRPSHTVMSPEEVDKHSDDISRRWQVVITLAGRLHIIDRDQTKYNDDWKERALCGVSQGATRGPHPLRPVSRPLSEILTVGDPKKPWCHRCVGAVRRAYAPRGYRDVETVAPMAGSSSKRVMLVGPINRKKDQGASYPGFRQAAAYLRNQYVQVSDPSDMLRSLTADEPYADHVRAHLEMFWDADALAVMEGWETSNIATLIVMTARVVRLPILDLSKFGGLTASEYGKWQTWCESLLRDEGKKAIW